jgi:hypothetical protein
MDSGNSEDLCLKHVYSSFPATPIVKTHGCRTSLHQKSLGQRSDPALTRSVACSYSDALGEIRTQTALVLMSDAEGGQIQRNPKLQSRWLPGRNCEQGTIPALQLAARR